MAAWERRAARPGRIIVAATLAGLIAVGAVLALLPGERSDQDHTLEVEHDAEPADPLAEDLDPAQTSPPVGAWEPLPEAPIGPREDHVMVWTGERLLVWGGRDADGWLADGAVYDPAERAWTVLPDAPGVAYPGTRAAWAGDRLVVVGLRGGQSAAYSAVSGDWEVIAAPPPGRWDLTAATDGRVVLAGTAQGEPAAVAYEADADRWVALPAPPAGGRPQELVALGARLVLLSPTGGAGYLEATAFDPSIGTWSDPYVLPALDGPPAVTGDPESLRVLLADASGDPGEPHSVGAWAPGDPQRWVDLPGLPGSLARAPPPLEAGEDGVLAWSPDDPGAGRWLGTRDGVWTTVALPPPEVRPAGQAAWSGEQLFVWGGDAATGAVWTPGERPVALPPADAPRLEGSWESLPAPPIERTNPSLAWSDGALIAWGGRTTEGEYVNDALVHRQGASGWETTAEAPIDGREESVAAWTGSELIVWGGHREGSWRTDGAALDPGTGAWRRLPDPPLSTEGPAVGEWVGDRLIVAAGPVPRIAAYDPDLDEWTSPASLPVRAGPPLAITAIGDDVLLLTQEASWRLSASTGVWFPQGSHDVGMRARAFDGGSYAVVIGGGRMARYDAEQRQWLGSSPAWSDVTDPPAGWTGRELVVWGAATVGDRARGRPGAAAYDPAADEWSVVPGTPGEIAPDGPAVWTGDRLVFWTAFGGPVAFSPGDRTETR